MICSLVTISSRTSRIMARYGKDIQVNKFGKEISAMTGLERLVDCVYGVRSSLTVTDIWRGRG